MQQMHAYEMVTNYETFKDEKNVAQSEQNIATLIVFGMSAFTLFFMTYLSCDKLSCVYCVDYLTRIDEFT